MLYTDIAMRNTKFTEVFHHQRSLNCSYRLMRQIKINDSHERRFFQREKL